MKLGLLAIFRNESHILDEFISFYRLQGVDHFYLINNASEDNYYPIIRKHSDYVSLFHDGYIESTEFLDKGGPQIPAYNRTLEEVETDWLYVCDLDEFAYARVDSKYNTIKDFIEKTQDQYDQVLVPLKIFNSSGNIYQPDSVVKGFTQVQETSNVALFKPIAKVSNIKKIWINHCVMSSGSITTNTALDKFTQSFNIDYLGDQKIDKKMQDEFRYIKDWNDYPIVSNHYVVQSYDWFWRVKATRGTATWHGGESQKAVDWFEWVWNRYEGFKTEYNDDAIKALQKLESSI